MSSIFFVKMEEEGLFSIERIQEALEENYLVEARCIYKGMIPLRWEYPTLDTVRHFVAMCLIQEFFDKHHSYLLNVESYKETFLLQDRLVEKLAKDSRFLPNWKLACHFR